MDRQTSLGWDAFCPGHISRSPWRRAILLSSSVRDDDVTEMHLRRLIKKSHAFSLSTWELQNEILHGDTREAQKAIRSSLIRAKVEEAYQYFQDKW